MLDPSACRRNRTRSRRRKLLVAPPELARPLLRRAGLPGAPEVAVRRRELLPGPVVLGVELDRPRERARRVLRVAERPVRRPERREDPRVLGRVLRRALEE